MDSEHEMPYKPNNLLSDVLKHIDRTIIRDEASLHNLAMSVSKIRSAARNLKSAGGLEFERILDDGLQAKILNKWLFEVSWEVANKVGGIYTVIRSKVPVTKKEYGDNYVCIGPLNDFFVKLEVDVCELNDPILRETVESMRRRRAHVVTGNWLIEGYPQVILFDIGSVSHNLGSWKKDFYEAARIGIPDGDSECNDVLLFGSLVAWFLGEFVHQQNVAQKTSYVISHYHEWQAGIGAVLVRTRKLNIATVFTTHATLLGRYLCAGDTDFYNNLSKFEIDREAGDRQIYHRYCIERAAVHCAHIFTTVSKITGIEAEHLLKEKPDILTPNGLALKRYEALHEFQNLHAVYKDKINEFIHGHFCGHVDFDLDKSIYIFSAGRYEYTNKGCDMLIEAIARLNHMLKRDKSKVTVFVFLIFPTETNNYNVESLKAQSISKMLRDSVAVAQDTYGKRLYDRCVHGEVPQPGTIVKAPDMIEVKKCLLAAQTTGLPPICTHNVVNDLKDPILNSLRRCCLFNHENDRVKVIFHPEFLKSTSPLLRLDYEEFVRGCHLGVFPSYYEPWGYTPAECTMMGVPSITTNLSGFGCFMEEHIADPEAYGIYVVDRRFKSCEESVQQLARYLYDFTQLQRRQRILLRNRTERLSELLDWSTLGIYYHRARQLALERAFPNFEEEQLRLNFNSMSVASSAHSSRSSTPAPTSDDETDEDADDLASEYSTATIEAPVKGLRQESIKSLNPLALADLRRTYERHSSHGKGKSES